MIEQTLKNSVSGEQESFAQASDDYKLVLRQLKRGEKLHVDSLIEVSGLTPQAVLRLLLEFELRGLVTQHPGKLFSLA
jgi:predicted Rossmann fold nucleotide-binding protein DprA/Smf involved in DNA uptake